MRILIISMVFIPSFCFSQKDSTKFIDNFYLEFNGGCGQMKYSDYYLGNGTNPPLFQEHKVLTADIDLNLNFRNQYLKLETTIISARAFFDTYYFGNYKFSLGGNFLFFTDQSNYFLGPKIRYGRIRTKLFEPRFDYFGFGLDFYFKKFHLDLYYDRILNIYLNTDRKYLSMYGLNLGYSFNLDSFLKKK